MKGNLENASVAASSPGQAARSREYVSNLAGLRDGGITSFRPNSGEFVSLGVPFCGNHRITRPSQRALRADYPSWRAYFAWQFWSRLLRWHVPKSRTKLQGNSSTRKIPDTHLHFGKLISAGS